MINIQEQESILLAIGDMLSKKIKVYAVGGTAMMLRGIKNSTLDIDIIFNNKKHRARFIEVLKKLGAKEFDATLAYGLRNNSPIMLEFRDCRFDLFTDMVISSNFSDKMKERAKQIHEFGNLIINVADIHDIIIMKSATSREKDIEDIISLIDKNKIDWDIILEGAKEQVELGNERVVLSLGEKLEKLKDKHNIDVPQKILDELWKILKKQIGKVDRNS